MAISPPSRLRRPPRRRRLPDAARRREVSAVTRQSPRGGPVTDETRRGGFGGFVGWGSLSPFRCPPVPLSFPFPFRRPIRCPFGQQKRQCFDFARDSKRDLVVPAKSATLNPARSLKHHPTRARRGDQIAVPGGFGGVGGHGAVGAMVVDELAVDLQYLVGVTGEPCMRVALTGSVAHQSPRGGIAEHRRQSCPDAMIVFPEGATMANRVSLANFAIAHARRTVSSALSSSGLAPKGTARRQRKRG